MGWDQEREWDKKSRTWREVDLSRALNYLIAFDQAQSSPSSGKTVNGPEATGDALLDGEFGALGRGKGESMHNLRREMHPYFEKTEPMPSSKST